jgi:hypothetical protein
LKNHANKILREYALRAIADDYENFEKILEDVIGWAAESGITAGREATLKALEGLIRDGYAQAYFLSSGPPARIEAVGYSATSVDQLWFYVTAAGKELALQLAEEWSG